MNWREKRLTKEYEERNRNILPHLKQTLKEFYGDLENPDWKFSDEQIDRIMKNINYLERSIMEIEGTLEDEI